MGSDPQQQFCLRWHNYQNSFLATLPQLLDGDDLTDVTLCAGGRSIKAHRIVLSACSQYFKDIFRELQPMQHPVIVLPGTEFSDLCALVTFMYSGEVNIYQHQLPGLLAMADTLHIRGLAEFTPSANQFENGSRLAVKQGSIVCKFTCFYGSLPKWYFCSKENERRGEISESSRCKRAKLSEPMVGEGLSKGGSCVKKERGGGRGGARGPLQDEDMAEDLSKRHDPDPASLPTDLSQGETSVRSQSKLYATCFVCGKQLSNQYNLRVHMETHQNAHYACTSCNHVSRSRDALRKHVSYRHPGAPTDMAKKLPNT